MILRSRPLGALLGAAVLLLVATDGRPQTSADAGAPPAFDPDLQAAATAAASERALGSASVGIAILDVDSGRWLATVNEHSALNPASNAKLFTAGAALSTLHGEHRYETALAGKIEGDAVAGSLGIIGFGDPSLKTSDLAGMVQELKAYGVRRVDGDIVVDQAFYDELTTPPAFEQQPNEWAAFRAPVSAVALDENCITLTVRPSTVGNPARVDVDPPGFVDLDGSLKTLPAGSADNVELQLTGNALRMSGHVSGGVGADSRLVRYTRRAEDPRLLAGYALKSLLERSDVKIQGIVRLGTASTHILVKHASEPVSSLLYGLGKQSDNFYAEMIFKSLAGEAKHRPAKTPDASEVVSRFVEQIGAGDTGLVFKNGSGLFDADRVTAFSTATLLRWAWRDPQIEPEYVAQLSVGGVDGTLHKRFRAELTKRRVRAKTGTLDDAIALSGYVLRKGKGPIAFSILYNRVAGKQDVARRAADRLVDLIAKDYP
jgi:D-alanyl-D-alanine carboxypeptidase/D-alanyl-D-alanine-endopeptidase (penicillin-binding protein 4)